MNKNAVRTIEYGFSFAYVRKIIYTVSSHIIVLVEIEHYGKVAR
jgi:hypothetical protein